MFQSFLNYFNFAQISSFRIK